MTETFPGGSDGEESICNERDLGSIPGLGRSSGRERGNPLQYSCLVNPHGQRSLAGYSPRGHRESDTTEQPSTLERQEGICKLFVGEISAYVIMRELDKAEDIKSKKLKR